MSLIEKSSKYYSLIERLVIKNRKYPGNEEILDDIIQDVYSHAEIVLSSITNESVIEAYLEKVISTSLITVPKKLNFSKKTTEPKVNNELVDRLINNREPERSISSFNIEPSVKTDTTVFSATTAPQTQTGESSNILDELFADYNAKNGANEEAKKDEVVDIQEKEITELKADTEAVKIVEEENLTASETTTLEEKETTVFEENTTSNEPFELSAPEPEINETLPLQDNIEPKLNAETEEIPIITEAVSDESEVLESDLTELADNAADALEEAPLEEFSDNTEVTLEEAPLEELADNAADALEEAPLEEFSDNTEVTLEETPLEEFSDNTEVTLEEIPLEEFSDNTEVTLEETPLEEFSDNAEAALEEVSLEELADEPILDLDDNLDDSINLDITQDNKIDGIIEPEQDVSEQKAETASFADYTKFDFTPSDNSSEIDTKTIEDDIIALNGKHPELNIIQVYNMKYKDNYSVDKISTQLNMPESSVLEALSELISLV